ncbi:MAG: hypothetical protein AUG49_07715 [Catenulispora sp. 13_1_20CM_3_70_7]|nr:DUF2516 family protein [Catenulisporales bacterium]OLE26582.1 MAG: hypothetical protein AUG49_07715 [Catenulispora sp. 13_1_20CM_3_70_7]
MIGSALRDGLYSFLGLLSLAVLVGQVVVLIDAALKREDAYRAAGKLTKPGWLIILTVAIAANMLLGLLFTIIGVVVAMVYWVDVRPALKEVSNSGGRRQGPYGPW